MLSHDGTTKKFYIVLPAQCLHPHQGYIFSRSEKDADSQTLKEALKTTCVKEFCFVVNEDLKWTLVEDSFRGVSLNGDQLNSTEKQKFLACVGYRLSDPQSETTLLANGKPNSQIRQSSLRLTLHTLSNAADYEYRSSNASASQPNQSTNLQQRPKRIASTHIAGTHKLATTDDIDAELLRQAGGDLTKGFYIDPARCVKAERPCQPLASPREGGDAVGDVESDEQGWTVLDDLDKLDLQGGNE